VYSERGEWEYARKKVCGQTRERDRIREGVPSLDLEKVQKNPTEELDGRKKGLRFVGGKQVRLQPKRGWAVISIKFGKRGRRTGEVFLQTLPKHH